MIPHYLAIVGSDKATVAHLARDVSERTGLMIITPGPYLIAFANGPDHCLPLPRTSGIVFGTLFSRSEGYESITDISEDEGDRITHSRGRQLVSDYWGGYVAFIAETLTDGPVILRDPSGAMPCYYIEVQGSVICSSSVDLLFKTGHVHAKIDLDYIHEHLHSPDPSSSKTALVGVNELLTGFKMAFTKLGWQQLQIWHPWDFVRPQCHLKPGDVIDKLRHTVEACTKAWASRFSHILLSVSGGLDSSILAGCLSKQQTPWTCLTMATDEPEGDERPYARILTRSLAAPLIEALHSPTYVDISTPSAPHLPRPLGNILVQSFGKVRVETADRLDMDVFFSGVGGDNVFCSMESATPFLDRLLSEGFSKGSWQTMNDICELTDCSYFDVLAMAAFRAPRRRALHSPVQKNRFISPLTSKARPGPKHPWLKVPAGGLPGKATHISMLLRVQATFEGLSGYGNRRTIMPLLSQPIVEFCLSIPSWQWINGGQNRSVAREAFSGSLPSVLIDRRSKGGADSFCISIIESRREALRAFLLGGRLIQNSLLDPMAIGTLLEQNRPLKPPEHMLLAALADTEAWLRHWEHQGTSKDLDPNDSDGQTQ